MSKELTNQWFNPRVFCDMRSGKSLRAFVAEINAFAKSIDHPAELQFSHYHKLESGEGHPSIEMFSLLLLFSIAQTGKILPYFRVPPHMQVELPGNASVAK